MRVLHLYAGNLFGGVETYLVTLAKTQALMPQMQHEFALCFPGRLATELTQAGAVVHELGAVKIRNPWQVWQARSRLRTVLRRGGFDVVICHACWSQAIFGTVVKSQRLPLVFYCRDTLSGQSWLEQLAKWTVPDFVVANSRYTQSTLATVYPGVPSQVVYHPVLSAGEGDRAEIRRQMRDEFQTPEDRVVIVQACRMERWKGHELLLLAVEKLKHVPNWEVWMVGGAQRPHEQIYLASLQAQAATLGISDRIKFLGQRSDVPKVLAAADVHCQPNSGGEPFGIAFIEALYAGLPLVTTAIGAATEIVDSTCGYLVPPGDSQAIAQCLERLITNPAERDRLAQGGFARANLLCNPVQQLTKLHSVLAQRTAVSQRGADPIALSVME
ncbi:glycosyltransferase [Myxacorys almedinensis]|uniref:Glycosyltransferase n=1 Tax=Myxacorys almedinensis A TaxID=2690445 RepID=A0A8J7YY18_9CYAN|nr:glycosyltransferase [Myxacorys almedinensis A]